MSESRKRILLTGATGFIGANLAHRLVHDGHEVHLLVRPADVDTRWRLSSIWNECHIHTVELQQRGTRRGGRHRRRPAVGVPSGGVRGVLVTTRRSADRHHQLQRPGESRRGMPRDRVRGVRQRRHLVRVRLEGPRADRDGAGGAEQPLRGDESGRHHLLPLRCPTSRSQRLDLASLLRVRSLGGPDAVCIPTLVLRGLQGELPPLVSPTIARDYVYIDDVVDAFISVARRIPPTSRARSSTSAPVCKRRSPRSSSRCATQFRITAEPSWGSMPDRDWDTDVWVCDPTSIQEAIGWKPAYDVEQGLRELAKWMTSDDALLRRYEACRTPPK